jgi:hypothetical protein
MSTSVIRKEDYYITEKIIYILLSLMLILVLTSCSNSTVETISESTIQTEAQTESAIEYKTIDPPEDGWTLELLNEVTYINGKDIDLPFSLNDIGWKETPYYSEYDEKFDTYFHVLSPPDENDEKSIGPLFVSIMAFANEDKTFDKNSEIYYLSVDAPIENEYKEAGEFLVINGIHIGDTKEEVFNKLGKPEDDRYIAYDIGNNKNSISLIFSTNDILDSILIIARPEEENK